MSTLLSRLYTWVTDKTNSVKITASRQDAELDQIITALNRKVLCSTSAPGSPIAGQTWLDTTNKYLKVYRSNEWVIITAVHVGTAAMSTPQEGDLWYDTTNNLLKAYDGSGWVMGGLNIQGLTEKTSLADADLFLIADSAASNALKKVQKSNVAGTVTQFAEASIKTVVTGNTTLPHDDTIPQSNEGFEVLTCAITPKSATNKLRITLQCHYQTGNTGKTALCLFQDSTADALAVAAHAPYQNYTQTITLIHTMTAGTTSATTFKMRLGQDAAGTLTVNGSGGNRYYGGVYDTKILIEEIIP